MAGARIPEFESYMPSHTVGLPHAKSFCSDYAAERSLFSTYGRRMESYAGNWVMTE